MLKGLVHAFPQYKKLPWQGKKHGDWVLGYDDFNEDDAHAEDCRIAVHHRKIIMFHRKKYVSPEEVGGVPSGSGDNDIPFRPHTTCRGV
jgi:hypothetical protein